MHTEISFRRALRDAVAVLHSIATDPENPVEARRRAAADIIRRAPVRIRQPAPQSQSAPRPQPPAETYPDGESPSEIADRIERAATMRLKTLARLNRDICPEFETTNSPLPSARKSPSAAIHALAGAPRAP